jgi:membrane protease YdiL (CAAX protease family)
VTRRRPVLPSDPGEAVRAGLPILLAIVAAAVPAARPFVLLALAAGFAVALRRDAPVRWAWAAPIAVVASLSWDLLPAPVADVAGGDCANPASPPALWRLAELVVVLVVVTVLAYLLRSSWRELGIRLPARPVIRLAAAAFLVLAPLGLVLGAWLGSPFFGPIRLDLTQPAALLPGLTLAVANATLEELAYRGAFLRWASATVGLGAAIVAQAVVFGVAHGGAGFVGSPLPVMAAMIAGGLVAGFLVVRTRSLLLPIAAHAALDLPLYAYLACPG